MIKVTINGQEASVTEGTTVASAIAAAGEMRFRRSVSGEARGPLCGMGICFECIVNIDGKAEQRSCVIHVRAGMEIETSE